MQYYTTLNSTPLWVPLLWVLLLWVPLLYKTFIHPVYAPYGLLCTSVHTKYPLYTSYTHPYPPLYGAAVMRNFSKYYDDNVYLYTNIMKKMATPSVAIFFIILVYRYTLPNKTPVDSRGLSSYPCFLTRNLMNFTKKWVLRAYRKYSP